MIDHESEIEYFPSLIFGFTRGVFAASGRWPKIRDVVDAFSEGDVGREYRLFMGVNRLVGQGKLLRRGDLLCLASPPALHHLIFSGSDKAEFYKVG